MRDVYLYEDCTVLKNKLGIKEQKKLEEAEADFVVYRLKELAMNPLIGNTRTTITFCCQYADEMGLDINRELFEKNSQYVRTALVAYNAVFTDLGDLSKKEYLDKIVFDAIQGKG